MLGGAIGAGSAVVMAAGVYGVKKGMVAMKKRWTTNKARSKYGDYNNATMEHKMDFVENVNTKEFNQVREAGKEINLINEYNNTNPNVTFDPETGMVIDCSDGESAWGYTYKSDQGNYDVYLSTRGESNYPYDWGDLFIAARHEARHVSLYFNKPWLPSGWHHAVMIGHDRRNSRDWNWNVDRNGGLIDRLLYR